MAITMAEQPGNKALLRLMAWLSPAFPVGSFSYSHGLERAVHDDLVTSREDLAAWIETLLRQGSALNDAVLLAESWRHAQTGKNLDEIADLAAALAGSGERHMESGLQGSAFAKAVSGWSGSAIDRVPEDCAYCVAFGAAAGAHGIALSDALGAYLQAFASNMIQASIRLGVMGQSGAVEVLAGLEPAILETAESASRSTLDDLGSCTVISDIMAMRHETQYSRLFRS